MLLDPVQAQRFIAGYRAILLHVHAVAKLKKGKSVIADLAAARGYLTERPQKLNAAFTALEAEKRGI
jgi:hypothetical protein